MLRNHLSSYLGQYLTFITYSLNIDMDISKNTAKIYIVILIAFSFLQLFYINFSNRLTLLELKLQTMNDDNFELDFLHIL